MLREACNQRDPQQGKHMEAWGSGNGPVSAEVLSGWFHFFDDPMDKTQGFPCSGEWVQVYPGVVKKRKPHSECFPESGERFL